MSWTPIPQVNDHDPVQFHINKMKP